MSEHLTRRTESVWKWCYHCRRMTDHQVSAGRVGRCVNSHAKPTPDKPRTPTQPSLWAETKGAA